MQKPRAIPRRHFLQTGLLGSSALLAAATFPATVRGGRHQA